MNIISSASPTALHLTFGLIREGKDKSFQECLNTEYNTACNLLDNSRDFQVGVTAKLIDKVKPIWNPSTFSEAKALIPNILSNQSRKLPFIKSQTDYKSSPYDRYRLPSIDTLKTEYSKTDKTLFKNKMLEKYHFKQGLDEKINNFLKSL